MRVYVRLGGDFGVRWFYGSVEWGVRYLVPLGVFWDGGVGGRGVLGGVGGALGGGAWLSCVAAVFTCLVSGRCTSIEVFVFCVAPMVSRA